MPLSADVITQRIQNAFPDAVIELTDLAGDNDHFAVRVVSAAFAGKTRVAQHKMVYDALEGAMDGPLHALSVKTECPK